MAAAIFAYHNSLGGPFIFDDPLSIADNPTIMRLGDIKEVFTPPTHGEAVQRRPVVNLSLAINYALGGLDVRGYHLFNLAAHVLAGLTLLGVVRRTLSMPAVSENIRKKSLVLSMVVAVIWVVHPLNTDAVTYIIQRTELLAGLFYLLSLYCVIRGSSSKRFVAWYGLAVLSCLLGMGSKEAMVSAPLVILLYDRVFLCGSFGEVLRRRWGLYVGLAGTWGLVLVLIPQGSEGAAVLGKGWDSLAYAATQWEAISTYLRLCFWPRPLILDYGLYRPTSFWQMMPYAMFIGALLAGIVWALRRRAWIGFLGVWFFAILAPSSSFVPVMNQWAAEKRMYLPLTAVVVMAVVSAYTLGRVLVARWKMVERLGYVLAGVIIVTLAALTLRRNYDYRSELAIWEDTVSKRPRSSRAYNGRGLVYWGRGEYETAIADFDRAARLNPNYAKTYNNRGLAYWHKGELEKAVDDFDRAIALKDDFARAYYNRASVHRLKGDYQQANSDFNKAVELGLRVGIKE